MNAQRLLPLSGVAFVTTVALAIVMMGNTPGTDASTAELVDYYGGDTTAQFLGVFSFAAGVPFLVLFAVGLASRLASHRPGLGPWEQTAIAGAILTGAGILLTACAQFALLDAADQEVAPIALQALNAVPNATWIFFNSGFGVMTLGVAGSLLATGTRRVLGWVALVLAVALFVPYADFFALLITLAWILVAGVVLARAPGGRTAAPAPA
jgi:hypothetical protein